MTSWYFENFVFYSGWFIAIPLKFILSCLILGNFKIIFNQTILKGNPNHVLAYMYVTYLMFIYLSCAGIYAYFNGMIHDLEENRYFGTSKYAELYILIPHLALSFWQFISSFILPDLFVKQYIIHHIFVFLISLISLKPLPQLHYYVAAYSVSEITNSVLIIIDVFKYFPNLKEKYKKIYTYLKILFAVTYFLIRIFWWNYINYKFYNDSFLVFKSGLVPNYILFVLSLTCNLILTFLQFKWGYIIIKIITGTKTGNENKKIKKNI